VERLKSTLHDIKRENRVIQRRLSLHDPRSPTSDLPTSPPLVSSSSVDSLPPTPVITIIPDQSEPIPNPVPYPSPATLKTPTRATRASSDPYRSTSLAEQLEESEELLPSPTSVSPSTPTSSPPSNLLSSSAPTSGAGVAVGSGGMGVLGGMMLTPPSSPTSRVSPSVDNKDNGPSSPSGTNVSASASAPRDAQYEFFALTMLAVKVTNGQAMESLYEISTKELWREAQRQQILFHQFHHWIETQLTKAYFHNLYTKRRRRAQTPNA